ncbi:MAG: methyltransferase, partial [Candidatus Brocadiia bacterium]
PDRIARNLWRQAGVKIFRQGEIDKILGRYPEDITKLEFNYAPGKKTKGKRYVKGQWATDEWGCRWFTDKEGFMGQVKEPPIKSLSEINRLTAPYEILNGSDFNKLNRMCSEIDAFTIGWTTVSPFERMQLLFGTEKLLIDLAYGSKEIFLMRDILHEFYMEDLRRWIETDSDGIVFMDDWGYQGGLMISPEMWEDFFKPLFRDYCELIHSRGKYSFFHSDGFIEELFPGLIEAGIDAINSQLFCMNIEELGRKYKGKITFWGEIDRQKVLPFGTREEVFEAVKRINDALWQPSGGVIAQCEFSMKDPVENIEAVFEAWETIT